MSLKTETRNCRNCKKDFNIESDDFAFYEKIKVPPPTFCPECRMIRRFLYRNERVWYQRKCDATGKAILSMYAPDKPYTVYDNDYWKSDAWDPMDYGLEYDSSLGFFDQFENLFKKIPHPNLIQKNNVNSDYTNYTLNLKNCYLCASVDTAEDCAYAFNWIIRTKNCFDIRQSSDCEFCYEIIDCTKSNRLLFSQNCESCLDSVLLYDCKNCSNCFGCVGLRNKQYCIFNEQYSKEEYTEKLKEYWNGNYSSFIKAKKYFEELKLKVPRKYANIIKSVNVSGDDIVESRSSRNSFSIRDDVENCRYCYGVWEHSKDGYDAYVAWKGAEMFYEVVSITAQRIYFSAYIWGGFDIEYSYNCFDCNNIFGCVGLRSKSYCIFNKQYSKEEYERIVSEIKSNMRSSGEYGEFFPALMSPFAYNETVAQDYLPKTKEEALNAGFSWRDPEIKKYNFNKNTDQIPDNIKDISENITEEIIGCEHEGNCEHHCSRAFRPIKNEVQFYKNMGIPFPRLCPFCRVYGRLNLKNPLKLWHRSCMKEDCSNEFETPYSPTRQEIVYCESCYQKEIY